MCGTVREAKGRIQPDIEGDSTLVCAMRLGTPPDDGHSILERASDLYYHVKMTFGQSVSSKLFLIRNGEPQRTIKI